MSPGSEVRAAVLPLGFMAARMPPTLSTKFSYHLALKVLSGGNVSQSSSDAVIMAHGPWVWKTPSQDMESIDTDSEDNPRVEDKKGLKAMKE